MTRLIKPGESMDTKIRAVQLAVSYIVSDKLIWDKISNAEYNNENHQLTFYLLDGSVHRLAIQQIN